MKLPDDTPACDNCGAYHDPPRNDDCFLVNVHRVASIRKPPPPAAGPWIPVTERMPASEGEEVLAFGPCGFYVANVWLDDNHPPQWVEGRECTYIEVSHWAEIRRPE